MRLPGQSGFHPDSPPFRPLQLGSRRPAAQRDAAFQTLKARGLEAPRFRRFERDGPFGDHHPDLDRIEAVLRERGLSDQFATILTTLRRLRRRGRRRRRPEEDLGSL